MPATAQALVADLSPELHHRSNALNDAPLREAADYVLVWLQQTLRGEDHPTIDAAALVANRLGLPLLVYHGLRCDYPYASARLSRFILGASAAMGRRLGARGIDCVQLPQTSRDHGKGMVYRLAAHAAAVFVDEHFTFVPLTQPNGIADKIGVALVAVDATRLVPVRALPERVGTTSAFRRAHSERRHEWLALRQEIAPEIRRPIADLPNELVRLADMSEAQLDTLVAGLPIDQALRASAEHPATQEAVDARVAAVDEQFIRTYSNLRNNPAIDHGTSRLSPYLRFGMTSPFALMRRIEALDVSASARYKFYDELMTWREWSHWRLWRNPELMRFSQLPEWSRTSLDAHRHDPREPALGLDALIHGESPDPVWNAAQKQWLATGWMHNNLRMYWSKGLIRWAPSPEEAWAWGCYINDRLSIDGRDPSTYVSMRWGYGDGRPAYRETPIFGRLMRNSPTALLKRDGVAAFVARWNAAPMPRLDVGGADIAAYL